MILKKKNTVYLLFISSFSVLFWACNGSDSSKNSSGQQIPDSAAGPVRPRPDPTKHYWHLEGRIGAYPVGMELFRTRKSDDGEPGDTGWTFQGTYYYQSKELPISLASKGAFGNNHQLVLEVNGDNDVTEIFTGTFDGLTFKGNWVSGKKKLPFELTIPLAGYQPDFQYYSADSVAVYKGHSASYQIAFLADADPNSVINDTLRSVLFGSGKKEAFPDLLRKGFEDYKTDYISEIKDFAGDKDFGNETLNYISGSSFFPILNKDGHIVFEYDYYAYTGGAHGNHGAAYYNYSGTAKKFYTASDVFKGSAKVLDMFINRYAHKKYRIPEDQSLQDAGNGDLGIIVDTIPFTDNFVLQKDGITFYYNPYEVTAYAFGIFDLFIPYSDLRPVLNPSFKY